MKTRDFDPAFSAALRNELEALADGAEHARPVRGSRRRTPQAWITAATALALLLATVGVLRLTGAPLFPAAGPAAPSPLSQITDPADPNYVARAVRVLLEARGTGPSARTMDVPADVTEASRYITCERPVDYGLGDGRGGSSSGGCDRTIGAFSTAEVEPGEHTVEVTVPEGVAWAVTIIAKPAPTISTGPLIDPLQQVRDRRVPDALEGEVTPVLQSEGRAGEGTATVETPRRSPRLRAYLVCDSSGTTARMRIDGHRAAGCMNSVAHWFDFTPSSRRITAELTSTGPWRLLVVPAPEGATDSPDSADLPYPREEGRVLARARGAGAPASGTYVRRSDSVRVVLTCRGTGFLEVMTDDGGTATRGAACGREPSVVGLGTTDPDDPGRGEPQRWTAIPHGDVSWTLQVLDG